MHLTQVMIRSPYVTHSLLHVQGAEKLQFLLASLSPLFIRLGCTHTSLFPSVSACPAFFHKPSSLRFSVPRSLTEPRFFYQPTVTADLLLTLIRLPLPTVISPCLSFRLSCLDPRLTLTPFSLFPIKRLHKKEMFDQKRHIALTAG